MSFACLHSTETCVALVLCGLKVKGLESFALCLVISTHKFELNGNQKGILK